MLRKILVVPSFGAKALSWAQLSRKVYKWRLCLHILNGQIKNMNDSYPVINIKTSLDSFFAVGVGALFDFDFKNPFKQLPTQDGIKLHGFDKDEIITNCSVGALIRKLLFSHKLTKNLCRDKIISERDIKHAQGNFWLCKGLNKNRGDNLSNCANACRKRKTSSKTSSPARILNERDISLSRDSRRG